MRILILNTTERKGGAAIAALRLFHALKNQGIIAAMLVRDKSTADPGVKSRDKSLCRKIINFIRFVTERLYFLPFERSSEIRFFFSPANTGEDLSRHPIVKEADIIHLHWINQGFLSLKDIGKLLDTGKPVVWTMHDMWPFTGGCHYAGGCGGYLDECGNCPFLKSPSQNDLSHRIWLKKEHFFSRGNLTLVGCSEWMAENARQSKLFGNMKIESIPNPIDTSVYTPVEKAGCRKYFGLPRNKFLILAGAANVKDKRKGMAFLISALEFLSEDAGFRENAALVTFGKADKDIEAGIPVYPVHYLKDEEKIAMLYSACDTFVLPSLEDNLPNTIMEAMSCGTPVVAFSNGGIPEMVTHQETGFLASSGNIAELSEGIKWLYSLPDLKPIGQASRKKVLETYSDEIVAAKYRSLYNTLLNHE